MPIHDWTNASPGYFHHFHRCWTGAICDALNGGLLPKGVFALLAQSPATEPSETRFVHGADEEIIYASKANRVALHQSDDTIAVIEVVYGDALRKAYDHGERVPHFVYQLGSPEIPSRVVRSGNVFPSGHLWVDREFLLSSESVAEAYRRTKDCGY